MHNGAAGTIRTVTVVTSSLGGWFAGPLADRFGRVRMLQIAILWYSVFTSAGSSWSTAARDMPAAGIADDEIAVRIPSDLEDRHRSERSRGSLASTMIWRIWFTGENRLTR
jgi:MFS family permease